MPKEPVLAVISGLGGKNWAPVHAFCEQEAVPCLFPNVEAPPADADRDFYSVYFSQGVLLEAGLIAHDLLKPASGKSAERVQQVYRAGDSGEAGAQALATALEGQGITVQNHVLARGTPVQSIAKAIRDASNADALVLWLRPDDIATLNDIPAPIGHRVHVGAYWADSSARRLPASWRGGTHLSYPFGLPEQRLINVDFALGWFRIRKIPVVDLRRCRRIPILPAVCSPRR